MANESLAQRIARKLLDHQAYFGWDYYNAEAQKQFTKIVQRELDANPPTQATGGPQITTAPDHSPASSPDESTASPTPTDSEEGLCDFKQYEHCGPHERIPDVGQRMPPFGCKNWRATKGNQ